MKRTDFLGGVILVSGINLFGFMKLSIANIITEWRIDGSSSEKIEKARDAVAIHFPYYFSIGLIILGLILLFYPELKKLWRKIEENGGE